jgi:hypothetical protein
MYLGDSIEVWLCILIVLGLFFLWMYSEISTPLKRKPSRFDEQRKPGNKSIAHPVSRTNHKRRQ